MSLINLIVILIFSFVVYLFWQSRGIAESAIKHIHQYCDKHELQVISVSRKTRKISWVNGKPGWHSIYQFEFSSNREDSYLGNIYLINTLLKKIDVPVYKL